MNQVERNRLVVDNLPLVGYLVSDLCARASHLSRDDLASVGAIALITSADSFNAELGIPFGAYARRRVVGAFADEMRSNDWAPRSARRRIRETLSVQETLTSTLGRTPSLDEIAAALGVGRETVSVGLADADRTVSSFDGSMAEFLVADDAASPEGELLLSERMAFLRAAVAMLPEKMRYVVEQVYFEDRSVKDVAEGLGYTHSAVSQQRAEAIRLLRDGLKTHYDDVTDKACEPESRLSAVRRAAYLEALASQTMGGIAKAARSMSSLEPAL